ncbi:DUF2243 domain-containing protein [Pseudorhodoferax soli]|uniref:Putative membrane protein n=1 Tax=Pseudorhodoferax soli TaxID=545864 RepID=A0A368XWQ8_9BURK|nr:DUF2243 domain-containing protein [Pseudorhodoferax soli]RCW72510.1 putative membrane protein [Pseudorhodoferax soli]
MTAPAPAPGRAALLLGIALGGFFDGIVLHQVLQWHHLLSGLERVRDLRLQLLADGLFHALMYLLALLGLALLWRARRALSGPAAGRVLGSAALVGFGLWHVLDALLSHWLLGLHRVRMDVADPLPWDLGWLAAFGLLPLAIALWWRRRPPPAAGPGPGAGHGRSGAVALGLAALLAGPLAALPAADADQVLVVFAPGTAGARAFDALARLDARVLWARDGVWAVQMAQPHQAWRLLGDGALLVGQGPLAGCLGWTRPAPR